MMVDTHTHLYLPEFDSDGQVSAVDRAISAGVGMMIFPNVARSTIAPMLELAAKFPDNVRCAMGLHPTEIGENWREDLHFVTQRFESDASSFVAIGEIGIDLYWDASFRDAQMEAFDLQCALALRYGLPVIIHCRDGLDEVLEVLKGHRGLRGVFHSFGGTDNDVERIRKVGDFFFGINGVVTFKNSCLRETLPCIGLERIVLETDSPYLTPVPYRGKRNESSYLPLICNHVAQGLSLSPAIVAAATTENAYRLFGIH